ncbi:MAG: hypothetical protein R2723_02770 [Microbacterium sp.]
MRLAVGEHDRQQPRLTHDAHRLERPALGSAELEPVQPDEHGPRGVGGSRSRGDDGAVGVDAVRREVALVVAPRSAPAQRSPVAQELGIAQLVVQERGGVAHPSQRAAQRALHRVARRLAVEDLVAGDVQVPRSGVDQRIGVALGLQVHTVLRGDRALDLERALPVPERAREPVEGRIVGRAGQILPAAVVEVDPQGPTRRHQRVEVDGADQEPSLPLGEGVQRCRSLQDAEQRRLTEDGVRRQGGVFRIAWEGHRRTRGGTPRAYQGAAYGILTACAPGRVGVSRAEQLGSVCTSPTRP